MVLSYKRLQNLTETLNVLVLTLILTGSKFVCKSIHLSTFEKRNLVFCEASTLYSGALIKGNSPWCHFRQELIHYLS